MSTKFSPRKIDLLIITGEHSGDQHIAKYVQELKTVYPDLNICAFGGEALSASGVRLLFNMTKFSTVGLSEVILKYFSFKKIFNMIISWISKHRPKVVCLVDYPGLNLKIAEILFKKKLSNKAGGPIKVIYYISPQIWAWKEKRKFLLEKYVDSLAVLFNFEKKYYTDTSLDVKFVGHPFSEINISDYVSYSIDAPVLLLPGSRVPTIKKIFPEMLKCFSEFSKIETRKMATVMYSDKKALFALRRILRKNFPELKGKVSFIFNGKKVEACSTIMSSGTMSLKCCLAGIPGVIIYKSRLLTFLIGKYYLHLKRLGMANILLNNTAWPEYIQNNISPKIIAQYINKCIQNSNIRKEAEVNANKLKEIVFDKPEITPTQWLISWIK